MRTPLRLLSVFLLAATVTACGGSQDTGSARSTVFTGNEDQLYTEGMRLFRAGDLRGALQRFEQAVKVNPRYLAAHIALGDTHYALADYRAAEADFARAIELRDSSADAVLGLARTLLALGRLPEARAAAERCIELGASQSNDTIQARGQAIRGEVALRTDDLALAVDAYERALALDATNMDARVELAALYARLDRKNDAIRLLGRVDPNLIPDAARYRLGVAFFQIDVHERAVEVLRPLHDANPDDDDTLYHLAAATLGAGGGQRDIAIQLAGKLLQRSPDYLPAYLVRGRGELQRGYTQKARSDAMFVLSRQPKDYDALLLLADTEMADADAANGAGNSAQADTHRRAAETAYLAAIEARPGHDRSLLALADLYFRQKRWAEFIPIAQTLVDAGRAGEDTMSRLASALTAAGRPTEAIPLQSRVADGRPNDYRAHFEVAQAALANPGSLPPEKILEHAQRAFEKSGGSSLPYRLLVIDALANAGRVDEALQFTRTALEAVPNNPDLRARRDRLQKMQ